MDTNALRERLLALPAIVKIVGTIILVIPVLVIVFVMGLSSIIAEAFDEFVTVVFPESVESIRKSDDKSTP